MLYNAQPKKRHPGLASVNESLNSDLNPHSHWVISDDSPLIFTEDGETVLFCIYANQSYFRSAINASIYMVVLPLSTNKNRLAMGKCSRMTILEPKISPFIHYTTFKIQDYKFDHIWSQNNKQFDHIWSQNSKFKTI